VISLVRTRRHRTDQTLDAASTSTSRTKSSFLFFPMCLSVVLGVHSNFIAHGRRRRRRLRFLSPDDCKQAACAVFEIARSVTRLDPSPSMNRPSSANTVPDTVRSGSVQPRCVHCTFATVHIQYICRRPSSSGARPAVLPSAADCCVTDSVQYKSDYIAAND
jgi:hypothetical protein